MRAWFPVASTRSNIHGVFARTWPVLSTLLVGCSLSNDLGTLQGQPDASASGGASSGGSGGSGGVAGATDAATEGSAGSAGGAGLGGSGGGAGCSGGLTECSGQCVSTLTDAKHCGVCGLDCGAANCNEGHCASESAVSRQCHGIAVNDQALYFTLYGTGNGANAGLFAANIGPATPLPVAGAPVVTGAPYWGAAYVALSGTSAFFTSHETHQVWRVATASADSFYTTTNLQPWDLAVAGGWLYFTGTGSGALHRRALSGVGAAEVVHGAAGFAPRHLALAAGVAYVTDDANEKVWSIDVTSKVAVEIPALLEAPYGIDAAASGGVTRLVVSRRNGADLLEWQNDSWSKAELITVPPFQSTALRGGDVVIAGELAYWSLRIPGTAGRLYARRLDRTTPPRLVWSNDSVDAVGLAATAQHVYFCTGAEVRRVRVAL